MCSSASGDWYSPSRKITPDSYLSSSDARLHVGLGTRTQADSVEVRWPNGTVQRFGAMPANTFIKIVEDAPVPQTIPHGGSRNR